MRRWQSPLAWWQGGSIFSFQRKNVVGRDSAALKGGSACLCSPIRFGLILQNAARAALRVTVLFLTCSGSP